MPLQSFLQIYFQKLQKIKGPPGILALIPQGFHQRFFFWYNAENSTQAVSVNAGLVTTECHKTIYQKLEVRNLISRSMKRRFSNSILRLFSKIARGVQQVLLLGLPPRFLPKISSSIQPVISPAELPAISLDFQQNCRSELLGDFIQEFL